jgi:hypothetical protein
MSVSTRQLGQIDALQARGQTPPIRRLLWLECLPALPAARTTHSRPLHPLHPAGRPLGVAHCLRQCANHFRFHPELSFSPSISSTRRNRSRRARMASFPCCAPSTRAATFLSGPSSWRCAHHPHEPLPYRSSLSLQSGLDLRHSATPCEPSERKASLLSTSLTSTHKSQTL